MTSKIQIVRRINELRSAGVSFRDIEAKLTKTLGMKKPGNGTRAFRIAQRRAA